MKTTIIIVMVGLIIGGILTTVEWETTYESSPTATTTVETVVEVDSTEARIKAAQEAAMGEIEAEANQMRDEFIEARLAEVESKVLDEIQVELKERQTEADKRSGAYWKREANVIAYIHKTFPEAPHLFVRIARGESGLKQWHPNGKVVRGRKDPDDTGLFQINNRYWGDEAERLGLDYENSIEDNIAMARHVYDTQGITAWVYYNDHIAMR